MPRVVQYIEFLWRLFMRSSTDFIRRTKLAKSTLKTETSCRQQWSIVETDDYRSSYMEVYRIF